MEHTPGPWKWLKEDYRGDWGFQYLVGPEEEGILVGADEINRPSKIIRVRMPIPSDEVELAKAVHIYKKANANLIAAAPDMLEALKAQEELDAHCDNCDICYGSDTPLGICDDGRALYTETVTMRKDAIAKAKGDL